LYTSKATEGQMRFEGREDIRGGSDGTFSRVRKCSSK